MREIKFRAWEKNLKEIIPIDSISFEHKIVNMTSAWRFFNEIELMQYTGLKDKNGKGIYEGDLITIDNPFIAHEKAIGVALIVFSHDYVGGWVAESKGEHMNIGTRTHMISVVGNIYENPNLMEESK